MSVRGRGRQGDKISAAYNAIPYVPVPIHCICNVFQVGLPVLRQQKRFDRSPELGTVRVQKLSKVKGGKGGENDPLMIWREKPEKPFDRGDFAVSTNTEFNGINFFDCSGYDDFRQVVIELLNEQLPVILINAHAGMKNWLCVFKIEKCMHICGDYTPIKVGDDSGDVMDIINAHIEGAGDVFDCLSALIERGYGSYARM